MQAESILKLNRWVRQGRYANRSQATQAALELLERRNALPTLECPLCHAKPITDTERDAWQQELELVDGLLDALEPPVPQR